MKIRHAILAAIAALIASSAPVTADEVADKLCAILTELVGDASLSGEAAKTAFNAKLVDAFAETPQTLGLLVRKADEIAESACADTRAEALAKLDVSYLSSAMY